MPYDEHPLIIVPDSNCKIWRYMDFSKFVSLLEEKALYFSNVKNFQDDPYEGSITKATIEKIKNTPVGQHNLQVFDKGRELIYVSSWHLSEYESVAMWRQYANSGIGIAIQSTVQRMKEAFSNTERSISIGKINYEIDYNSQEIKELNVFVWALHKRKHFKADEEVRALFLDTSMQQGHLVPVNLERLIEKIIISPNSPQWHYELINKLLIRYGIVKKAEYSEI